MRWIRKKTPQTTASVQTTAVVRATTSQESVQGELQAREIAAQEALLTKYDRERNAAATDLEKCKAQIEKIQNALVFKRNEYNGASVSVRPVVVAEIKNLAAKLELQKGEYELVLERIEQCDVMIAKTRQTIQGLRAAEIAQDAEDLAVLRSEVEDQRARNDASIRMLNGVGRSTCKVEQENFDVDAFYANLGLETETAAENTTTKSAALEGLKKIDEMLAKTPGEESFETL